MTEENTTGLENPVQTRRTRAPNKLFKGKIEIVLETKGWPDTVTMFVAKQQKTKILKELHDLYQLVTDNVCASKRLSPEEQERFVCSFETSRKEKCFLIPKNVVCVKTNVWECSNKEPEEL
jgi:hypothetical protein